MKRYLILLTVSCAAIMIAFKIVDSNYSFSDHSFSWWVLPLTFYAISMAGHFLMLKSIRGQGDQFMIFFLLSVTVKLFLYLGLLLIWFFISGQMFTIPFITAFAMLYIITTIIDLSILLPHRKVKP